MNRSLIATGALALLGLVISGYLLAKHVQDVAPTCSSGGCAKVQASDYSELLGVPVAALGVAGYLAILIVALRPSAHRNTLLLALTVVGAGFSIYLQAISRIVIGALCQWCAVSALIMIGLLVISSWRWVREGTPSPAHDAL